MYRRQKDSEHGSFANPYTFAPFVKPEHWTVDNPWWQQPAGHDRMGADRLSGVVEVQITTQSPLLIRHVVGANVVSVGGEEKGQFPRRRVGAGGEEEPFIPGSTIAGVVRSLHETLAGGCLRVFDGDFIPGYRDPVRTRVGHWYMARVESVDGNGQPTGLTICPRHTRVPVAWLAEVLGGWQQVRTGATVHVRDEGRTVAYGQTDSDQRITRLRVTRPADVERGDDWVVLLTDGTRGKKPHDEFLCAVGKIGGAERPVIWDHEKVWKNFLDAVADTNDVRLAVKSDQLSRGETEPPWVEVASPKDSNKPVGYRIAARRRLFKGQVVWVRLTEPYLEGDAGDAQVPSPVRVREISLAQIWRHQGEHSAGERLPDPEKLSPCQDVAQLCPTCRVFGSAETGGTNSAASTQKSYRGHVRFSDAILAADTKSPILREYELPMLAAPRPGAGQFYVQNPRNLPRPDRQQTPQREWGSVLDATRPRLLRGRKLYWLTSRWRLRPFFRATRIRADAFQALNRQSNGGKDAKLSRAEAVPANVSFQCTVRFENLADAELGGLLASLAPQTILTVPEGHSGPIGFAVGGGRPLGFGSCTAEIVGLETYSARSRYTASALDDTDRLTIGDAVDAFRGSAPKDLRKWVWTRVAHALCLDRVSPHHVWYPPAGELSENDETFVLEHLLTSREFWRKSHGDGRGKLQPLPHLGGGGQTLEVILDAQVVQQGIDR